MKIIFLDVDGVLNTDYTKERCGIYIGIEDRLVVNLARIVEAVDNCKIVLSSTWRLGINNKGHRLEHHWEYLRDKLAKQGLEVFDKTENLSRHGECRGKEIDEWLSRHPDVEQWVVLDDEWFGDFNWYDIGSHLIATNPFDAGGGLNDEKIEETIRVLNGGLPDETR